MKQHMIKIGENEITLISDPVTYPSLEERQRMTDVVWIPPSYQFSIFSDNRNTKDSCNVVASSPVKRWNWIGKDITDVNILAYNKVVEVTFADGGKEKAVCDDIDEFNLEQAISICLAKHLIGGSSEYNKTIKKGLKIYDDKIKKMEEDKAEQERIEQKRAKRAKKNAIRKARREKEQIEKEAAEREKAIEIQKEAYLRAMKEMEGSKLSILIDTKD